MRLLEVVVLGIALVFHNSQANVLSNVAVDLMLVVDPTLSDVDRRLAFQTLQTLFNHLLAHSRHARVGFMSTQETSPFTTYHDVPCSEFTSPVKLALLSPLTPTLTEQILKGLSDVPTKTNEAPSLDCQLRAAAVEPAVNWRPLDPPTAWSSTAEPLRPARLVLIVSSENPDVVLYGQSTQPDGADKPAHLRTKAFARSLKLLTSHSQQKKDGAMSKREKNGPSFMSLFKQKHITPFVLSPSPSHGRPVSEEEEEKEQVEGASLLLLKSPDVQQRVISFLEQHINTLHHKVNVVCRTLSSVVQTYPSQRHDGIRRLADKTIEPLNAASSSSSLNPANDLECQSDQIDVDILFLIDTMTTMTDVLHLWKTTLSEVEAELRGAFKRLHVGLLTFNRKPSGSLDPPTLSATEYCTSVDQSLTDDITCVFDLMNAIEATSGKNDEAHITGSDVWGAMIQGALGKDINWSAAPSVSGLDAVRYMVVLTNNLPLDDTSTIVCPGPNQRPHPGNGEYDCLNENYPSAYQALEALQKAQITPIIASPNNSVALYYDKVFQDFPSGDVLCIDDPETLPCEILDAVKEMACDVCPDDSFEDGPDHGTMMKGAAIGAAAGGLALIGAYATRRREPKLSTDMFDDLWEQEPECGTTVVLSNPQ